mmetsp:Transcript_5447/g.15597  ORF Transcript_5447/g.15597 Transcript_5447/m.15597 type:complete len:111 (+) Transcript_5447:638-970(+)
MPAGALGVRETHSTCINTGSTTEAPPGHALASPAPSASEQLLHLEEARASLKGRPAETGVREPEVTLTLPPCAHSERDLGRAVPSERAPRALNGAREEQVGRAGRASMGS